MVCAVQIGASVLARCARFARVCLSLCEKKERSGSLAARLDTLERDGCEWHILCNRKPRKDTQRTAHVTCIYLFLTVLVGGCALALHIEFYSGTDRVPYPTCAPRARILVCNYSAARHILHRLRALWLRVGAPLPLAAPQHVCLHTRLQPRTLGDVLPILGSGVVVNTGRGHPCCRAASSSRSASRAMVDQDGSHCTGASTDYKLARTA